jgi:hypothetical protein
MVGGLNPTKLKRLQMLNYYYISVRIVVKYRLIGTECILLTEKKLLLQRLL